MENIVLGVCVGGAGIIVRCRNHYLDVVTDGVDDDKVLHQVPVSARGDCD